MKKLLQLNATANWGSTGKIAEGIGLSAMERGWKSYIAYGRYMNPSKSDLIKVGSNHNVYAHYVRNRCFDGEGLGSKNPTKQLIQRIEQICPDIIHLHNIHDHWLNYPILFDYLATVHTPVVWTFHDCWAFTGGCYHFENIKCLKWKGQGCISRCPLNHKRAWRNYAVREKCISRIGSRLNVVTVSEWLKQYAEESMINNYGADISVIYNGINVDSVFNLGGAKHRRILGVSNVWSVSKGLNDFYRLREILPSDIEIVLVGLQEKQLRTLPSGIKGITRTSDCKELAELYASAAVFVNPTYNDSFPTVNLEALACGTPVITYRTGGSPEAIDANTGIVVDKGDIYGLARSITEVVNFPQRYSSSNCRERAVLNFNQKFQFKKYIDLYDNLIANE